MINQPLNPKTSRDIESYLSHPGQPICLVGSKWLNKADIANNIAEGLLELDEGSLNKYPYILSIGEDDATSISIDQIREINSFLSLKVPSKKTIRRVIIINNADKMTTEAQNALLKNLEEPPLDTIFILTTNSTSSLLETIISRMHIVKVIKPDKDEITSYYLKQGYSPKDINQAYLISDGLNGLMDILLTDKDNPISQAADQARKLLTSSSLDRLKLINDLSKNKAEIKNIMFIIKQMAKIGVASDDHKSSIKWQGILSATLDSEKKLSANVQTKLLLIDYMLSLT